LLKIAGLVGRDDSERKNVPGWVSEADEDLVVRRPPGPGNGHRLARENARRLYRDGSLGKDHPLKADDHHDDDECGDGNPKTWRTNVGEIGHRG
jgi:hypothetical protein